MRAAGASLRRDDRLRDERAQLCIRPSSGDGPPRQSCSSNATSAALARPVLTSIALRRTPLPIDLAAPPLGRARTSASGASARWARRRGPGLHAPRATRSPRRSRRIAPSATGGRTRRRQGRWGRARPTRARATRGRSSPRARRRTASAPYASPGRGRPRQTASPIAYRATSTRSPALRARQRARRAQLAPPRARGRAAPAWMGKRPASSAQWTITAPLEATAPHVAPVRRRTAARARRGESSAYRCARAHAHAPPSSPRPPPPPLTVSCFEACPAGTSFITDQNACVECAAGSFAAAGDAACTPCPAGSASSVTGATSASACELCGGGSYSSVPGAAACTSCAAAFPDVTTIKPATSACFPNTITTCDPTGHFVVANPQKLPPYVGATSAAACCCVGSPQLCKAYEGLPGGWACPAFGCPGEAPPTADTSAVACSQDSLCSDYVSLTWLQAPFGATTGNPLLPAVCPSPPPPLAA